MKYLIVGSEDSPWLKDRIDFLLFQATHFGSDVLETILALSLADRIHCLRVHALNDRLY